jgi:hypothetical protein
MLRCTKDFTQGDYRFAEGATVALAPAAETWLLESYPGYFERVQVVEDAHLTPAQVAQPEADEPAEAAPESVEARDIEEPQVDKMIRRPRGRK